MAVLIPFSLPLVLTPSVDVGSKSLRVSVPLREPERAKRVPQQAVSLEALRFFEFDGKQMAFEN